MITALCVNLNFVLDVIDKKSFTIIKIRKNNQTK
jgi:hypothetical protein